MKSKLLVLPLVAGALLAGGLMTTDALAYRGDPTVAGPNCTPERHTAMQTAFENGDYAAWKELMGDRGRVTQLVTEENFPTFVEMHDLMVAGDTEGAKTLRAELGLGVRAQDGNGWRGQGMGMHQPNR